MSLSPSQALVVHDLDYLRNMSQLIQEEMLKHRFVPSDIERQWDGERIWGSIGPRNHDTLSQGTWYPCVQSGWMVGTDATGKDTGVRQDTTSLGSRMSACKELLCYRMY